MGTYYDCKINDRRESKKIDAYLAEIDEVSKKHGFCIIFKIEKESFAITDYNEDDIKYISCANIDEECDNDKPQNKAVAMMTEYEQSKELKWTPLRPDFACVFATKKHGEYQIWRFCWGKDESLTGVEYGYYLAWTTNEGDEWDEIEDCDFEEYLVLEILPTMEEVHKDRTDKW